MQGFWNLIGKSGEGPGKDFQYDIGEAALSSFDSKSIWTLHHGKKRANGDVVSVFICNAKVSSPDEFHLAKTAHKRLKTLRHPNIIKYLDGFESENLVYMVTEPVVPLSAFVDEKDGRNPNLINWGLYQVINGLSFLVNDVKLIHENVNIFSVFVGLDGEWKLGGVEYMHTAETTPVGKLPCLCRYDPPEGNCSRKREVWSADAWGLGCLIWEIHNGALQRASDLKVIEKIPKLLLLHYCDLVHANPKKRTNPKDFLQRCMESGQFFDNDFVKANLFLNEIQIKDTAEQKEFFISLNKSLDSFPKQFCVHKVLPQLLNAFEFGSAGSAVLSPLFKVGLLLDDVAYQAKIVPCIIKLFSSNDRATRIQLLQQMEKFVMHLQPSVVDNQIFACIATGFGDTLPAMREQTIKAMLLLAPKLSAKTFNNQLLRYFAKLQMDEQPGIRTNTTICLGKIAEHIPTETRQKVLVPAFTRGIHDPFPPARTASIMAISATHKYYSSNDIAVKLLPALCAATIDPERSVRENAFKVIKTFIMLLEDQSTELGDNAASSTDSSKQGNETGSTWTGWAVSSFTSRFYQNTPSSSGQSKEEISNKQKPVEQCAEKKSVETPPPAVDVDRSSDHSNYDDAFDDDYWGDTKVENKPTESTLHQKMEDAHTKKAEIHRNKCDGDSDSDYGDWGEGGDGWGKENDDWESLDGLQSKSTKKNTEAFIEKPFSNEISSKSTQKPVSLLTNTKEVKDSSPVVQNKSLPLTSSNINWGDNATEWAGVGWDDNIGWDNEEKKKEEEKEKRKQDLQRKREEKKLQRELANKEKKAKSSGAMKLGAVKKNPKGDG